MSISVAPGVARPIASVSAASAPEVSKITANPASESRAARAPSETARSRRPGCGSSTYGEMPEAASATQSSVPCDPAPTTRHRLPGAAPLRLIAASATVSGSAQTASVSVQSAGTGHANAAGTAIRAASVPGAVKPTITRFGHMEVRPDLQAGQRRHG